MTESKSDLYTQTKRVWEESSLAQSHKIINAKAVLDPRWTLSAWNPAEESQARRTMAL